MFFMEKGAVAMPLWEKVLVLFIITISVTSLYAVVYTYIESHRNADNTTDPDNIGLVSRMQWGAQTPFRPSTTLAVQPIPNVIISHTATDFCYTKAKCILMVRNAQAFYIESKGCNDIGYNFLVGGDGGIYEGRGWDVEGDHTFKYNHKSIGVAFIGRFNNARPTAAQINAAHRLISHGAKSGKLTKDYKLLGHRQCSSTTESPGDVLYNIIKSWQHWSPTP